MPSHPAQGGRCGLAAGLAIGAWVLVAGSGSVSAEAPVEPQSGRVVWQSEMEDAPEAPVVWTTERGSLPRMFAAEGHRIVGPFGRDHGVIFLLSDLPPHQYVVMEFDLHIMGRWAAAAREGRRWRCWSDGTVLIDTSFSNAGAGQDWPAPFGTGAFPPRTGASEVDRPGQRDDPATQAVDTVYRMEVVLPHTRQTLRMGFRGTLGEAPAEQSWGIGNVRVRVMDDPPHADLNDEQLNRLWAELVDRDPVRQRAAFWTLAGGGQSAADFLRSRLVGQDLDEGQVARLAGLLDDDDWRQRERATWELIEMGPGVGAIIEAMDEPASLEARARRREVLLRAQRRTGSRGRQVEQAERILDLMGQAPGSTDTPHGWW